MNDRDIGGYHAQDDCENENGAKRHQQQIGEYKIGRKCTEGAPQ